MAKMLKCRVIDPAMPGGSGDILLNLDHVLWICEHPERRDMTLAKLVGDGNSFLILAPLEDVRCEMEESD
jgi:hypothetical protein